MQRSIRWLDRCIEFHEKSGKSDTQNLFAIVQGGLNPVLRDECLDEMIKRRDKVAGYAIGGLSGGEEKGISPTRRMGLRIEVTFLNLRYLLADVSELLAFSVVSYIHLECRIHQCAEKLPADSELDVPFQRNVTDTE